MLRTVMKDEDGVGNDTAAIDAALKRLQAGDKTAWQELMPLVYGELHSIARREMSKQAATHTLQATALVNEAFVKLCRGSSMPSSQHNEFLGLAATAMRSILTDHARAKNCAKRSAPGGHVVLSDALELVIDEQWSRSPMTVLELNDLLDKLAEMDPQGAKMVELRYFAGRTVEEAAAAVGISVRTSQRHWLAVAAWMKRELEK